MSKESVKDIAAKLCGALSDLGADYHCDFDNRGGNRSAYIFVRRPLPAKIRVADHRSTRIDKDKGRAQMLIIDVAANSAAHKHGVSWQEAIAQIATVSASSK